MPIYDFKCERCGKEFELLLGVAREKEEKKCPYCKSNKIEKRFSTFSVKGSREGSNCRSCIADSCDSCN